MSKAMDFIINGDPTFRKQIDGCLVNFSTMMAKYSQHVRETPKDEQETPAEFLSKDFLLEIMIKDFGCYDDALRVMTEYSKVTF